MTDDAYIREGDHKKGGVNPPPSGERPTPPAAQRPQASQPSAGETAVEEAPLSYALVEVMGHRRHFGRIFEVEQYGAKMLRVDVPKDGDFAKGYNTHFYSGQSIFCITPCTLETVVTANKPYERPQLYHHAADDEPDHDDDRGDPEGDEDGERLE